MATKPKRRRIMKPCDEPCRSCGHADVSRRFIAKGGIVPHEGYGLCANQYAKGQCHYWEATRSHLHNICLCCGFTWQSLPMAKP